MNKMEFYRDILIALLKARPDMPIEEAINAALRAVEKMQDAA